MSLIHFLTQEKILKKQKMIRDHSKQSMKMMHVLQFIYQFLVIFLDF